MQQPSNVTQRSLLRYGVPVTVELKLTCEKRSYEIQLSKRQDLIIPSRTNGEIRFAFCLVRWTFKCYFGGITAGKRRLTMMEGDRSSYREVDLIIAFIECSRLI
ncbi:hypothetical protein Trydic_g20214 [Trypoxylus dichotomus]